MDDHLGVRLAQKDAAAGRELLAQGRVVFDDAVVDDGELAVVADVGVGVQVSGRAVGGPAGVAYAGVPGQVRAAVRLFTQCLDAPAGLGELQPGLAHDGETCRVVAPVFQGLQPLQQHRRRLAPACEADDSAHIRSFPVTA